MGNYNNTMNFKALILKETEISKKRMNKYKRKKCVTFRLSYSCLKAKGFHQSLDEVCLSSFSYAVSSI